MYFVIPTSLSYFLFFFNDTATTEIYTLSLHDALPILPRASKDNRRRCRCFLLRVASSGAANSFGTLRSEEHTSELQSHLNLVCRLLLEKKKHTALLMRCGTHARCSRSVVGCETRRLCN